MRSGLLTFLTDMQKLAALRSQPQHEDFLDNHFSLSPQWKTFKKKLRSPSFVSAVKQDTRSDDKLKRYSDANAKHLQARGVPTFVIPSRTSSGKYSVKYHPDIDRFSCNCGDWVHTRSHQTGKSQQDCKHIAQVRTKLHTTGKAPEELAKQAAMGRAALQLLADMS